ncbi:DUF1569 domain-containing protein [Yoonia maricola]|nr:DUF1569 domain-containing protein [Yoonia maricola]
MPDIDLAFARLEGLDLSAIESTGDWGLGRVFNHLAQGVEFSMHGYPVQKPKLFQATVGTLAFKMFSARGKMKHGLDEPIPGEVVSEISAEAGLERLWTSLETFRNFEGKMQPHFAYGGLSKAQFGKAHLLHIENHLEEVGS